MAWCHVACMRSIPELGLADDGENEFVTGLDGVPKERARLVRVTTWMVI